MSYWRMQLHPNEPKIATFYTIKSLANNFIGLGFEEDPGDLTQLPINSLNSLETTANNIKAFVYDIKEDDYVLIFLHNNPFALVTKIGEYNYIKNPVIELDIWFKHFRKVLKIYYYSDVFGKIQDRHGNIIMINRFAGVPLKSESGKLITEWKNLII